MTGEVEIKIDQIAAQEFVQKAIFEAMTEESRAALVQSAITALTVRPKKQYGYGSEEPRSPLEQAFDRAVQDVSYSVVKTYLDDETIKNAIRDQIFKALDDIVKEKGTWLYDSIGVAVGRKIQEVLAGDND